MLNTLKSVLSSIILALTIATPSIAMELKEGTDYQVVTADVTKDKDVRVYFSFRCWHCATMDTTYAEVTEQLPSDVCVKKIPVFNPQDQLDILYAKGLAVAEENNKDKQYTHAMFEALKSNQAPQCLNTLTEFFAKELDIEPLVFQKQFLATKTNDKLNQYLADSTTMNINAVPVVIVGNQYQLLPKRVSSFQEYKDLLELIVKKNLGTSA